MGLFCLNTTDLVFLLLKKYILGSKKMAGILITKSKGEGYSYVLYNVQVFRLNKSTLRK